MRWQKAKMRQLKTLSSFGWWFGCLGGSSVWRSSRLVWVRFLPRFPRVIPLSVPRLLCGWVRFVGVVCAVLPCPATCGGGGRLLVRVSTLLILRAVYSLYIPALRNLMGFIRAKIRFWITSSCGQNLIVYGGLYML